VAVGKRADLLLVEGDPSRDIEALGRIRQVFLEGVPLERVPVGEAARGDARD
jgi:imidazolonepropionase-like amidohydrolase